MKAIILSGGFGLRLKTIGKYIPKPLLTINGKPNIDYIIEKAEAFDEIDKIIILVNSRYKDQFFNVASNEMMIKKKQIIVVEEPNTIDKKHDYGVIGGLYWFFKTYTIDDDVMIIGGDNFFTFSLKSMMEKFKKYKKPIVAIYRKKKVKKDELQRLANARIKNEKVIEYDIKPKNPKTKNIGTMIYILPKCSQIYIQKLIMEGIKEPTGKIIEKVVKSKVPVYYQLYTEKDGIWIDIGVEKDYKKVFKYKPK